MSIGRIGRFVEFFEERFYAVIDLDTGWVLGCVFVRHFGKGDFIDLEVVSRRRGTSGVGRSNEMTYQLGSLCRILGFVVIDTYILVYRTLDFH